VKEKRGMLAILQKKVDFKTPLILRIGVILEAFFVTGRLGPFLEAIRFGVDWKTALMTSEFIVHFSALVAIWNMRRWGVIVLALGSINGAIAVWFRFGYFPIKATIFILILRGLILVPAVIYWKKMTN
jgi:hypothetical protein